MAKKELSGKRMEKRQLSSKETEQVRGGLTTAPALPSQKSQQEKEKIARQDSVIAKMWKLLIPRFK